MKYSLVYLGNIVLKNWKNLWTNIEKIVRKNLIQIVEKCRKNLKDCEKIRKILGKMLWKKIDKNIFVENYITEKKSDF